MPSRLRSAVLVVLLFASSVTATTAITVVTSAPVAASCSQGGTLDAAQLNTVFSAPAIGTRVGQEGYGGGDYQHAYPLPNGRVLWLFQDMYFSDDNNLNLPPNNAAHNAGLLQDGSCFSVIGGQGRDFIGDNLTIDSRRWFWPLDGEIGYDGNLFIYMVEMYNPAGTGAGPGATPQATWLAVVDPMSLQVLSFALAPDSGRGLYGWSVVSNDQYSYLYGHCYRQFAHDVQGPGQFDATCMPSTYLARVPLGHFEAVPEYWNGVGWSGNSATAQPVMTRGAANPMSVQWFGNVFVSVTKIDDWWGSFIFVDRAAAPQGPWQSAQAALNVLADRKCATNCGNYSAFLMPWLDQLGRMTIGLSNGGDFALWRANAALYRPTFYSLPVPAAIPLASAATAPAFPLVTGNAGFLAVDPVRLVDTREPGQAFSRMAAGSQAVLDLNRIGMPAGATAVALNITATKAALNGWVRAYPCTAPEPTTSNVNPLVGQTQTNAVVVSVGDGRICLRTLTDVDLVIDLNGWLTTGSQVGLQPVASQRLVDTRIGLGGSLRMQPGQVLPMQVVPAGSATTAVALNVTAVDPLANGFVTVWPCGITRPVVSNLNPQTLVTQPNYVNVRVGTGGMVCVYSTVETDLVVDLFGQYRPGAAARYASLPPQRLLDTRVQPPPRHQSNLSYVLAMGSIVAAQVNLSATDASADGFLTGYPCMTDQWPGTSNVNYVTALASANSALLTNSRGYACVFPSKPSQLVVDIFGIWTS